MVYFRLCRRYFEIYVKSMENLSSCVHTPAMLTLSYFLSKAQFERGSVGTLTNVSNNCL